MQNRPVPEIVKNAIARDKQSFRLLVEKIRPLLDVDSVGIGDRGTIAAFVRKRANK